MKKTYRQPAVFVTAISTQVMISQSLTGTSGADGLGMGGDSESAGITSGNTKGRGNDYDVWGDDWSK